MNYYNIVLKPIGNGSLSIIILPLFSSFIISYNISFIIFLSTCFRYYNIKTGVDKILFLI